MLKNPYITEIFLYDTLEEGIKAKDFRFHFTELFNRKDIDMVLKTNLKKITETIDIGNKINQNIKIEDMNDNDISLLTNYIICSALYDYYNNHVKLVSNSLRYSLLDIQTLGGLWLQGIKNRTWSNVLGGEIAISIAEQNYEKNYPNAVKLQDKSPIYNCHCYAWHTNYVTSDNYIWIEPEEALTYLEDSHCSLLPRVQTGCQVVYFNSNGTKMLHSGFVTGISGNNIYVVSKIGNCGVYRHLLKDCSYYEDSEGYINFYSYN